MRHLSLGTVVVVAASVLVAGRADAASMIKDPNPPKYHVEIEPHLILNPVGFDYRDTFAWGPGIRFSIPVMSPGFVKKINDSVAITFGADVLNYGGYTYCDATHCWEGSFWTLYAPVAVQWNFWLTEQWSVYGELGGGFRNSFDNTYCGASYCRTRTGFFPAFNAGARFHFNDHLALNLRAGYPTGLSVGLSIF